MMNRNESGFTLLELLLAGALLLVVLGVMTSFLQSSERAHQTTARVTRAEDQLDLITQLLDYDLRLAGYRQEQNGKEAIVVAPDSSWVETRYFEDRFGENIDKHVRYEVGKQSGSLTRTEWQAGRKLEQVLSMDAHVAFELESLGSRPVAIMAAVTIADATRMVIVPLIGVDAGGS